MQEPVDGVDAYPSDLALGDVTGDGLADILVGHAGGVEGGYVRILYGSAHPDSIADVILHPPTSQNHYFGSALAVGGDLDADGFGDLVVGAPGLSGYVHFYSGGPQFDADCEAIVSVYGQDDAFGDFIAMGGDVTGDGVVDVLISAPDDRSPGATMIGKVYVFSGAVPTDSPGEPHHAVGRVQSLDVSGRTLESREVQIRYTIPEAARAQLDIYDVAGRRVQRVFDRLHTPGEFKVLWDGRTREDRPVSRGVYILRLRTDRAQVSHKFVLR